MIEKVYRWYRDKRKVLLDYRLRKHKREMNNQLKNRKEMNKKKKERQQLEGEEEEGEAGQEAEEEEDCQPQPLNSDQISTHNHTESNNLTTEREEDLSTKLRVHLSDDNQTHNRSLFEEDYNEEEDNSKESSENSQNQFTSDNLTELQEQMKRRLESDQDVLPDPTDLMKRKESHFDPRVKVFDVLSKPANDSTIPLYMSEEKKRKVFVNHKLKQFSRRNILKSNELRAAKNSKNHLMMVTSTSAVPPPTPSDTTATTATTSVSSSSFKSSSKTSGSNTTTSVGEKRRKLADVYAYVDRSNEEKDSHIMKTWLNHRAKETEEYLEELEFKDAVISWSTNRARMEEEIHRRHESSIYSAQTGLRVHKIIRRQDLERERRIRRRREEADSDSSFKKKINLNNFLDSSSGSEGEQEEEGKKNFRRLKSNSSKRIALESENSTTTATSLLNDHGDDDEGFVHMQVGVTTNNETNDDYNNNYGEEDEKRRNRQCIDTMDESPIFLSPYNHTQQIYSLQSIPSSLGQLQLMNKNTTCFNNNNEITFHQMNETVQDPEALNKGFLTPSTHINVPSKSKQKALLTSFLASFSASNGNEERNYGSLNGRQSIDSIQPSDHKQQQRAMNGRFDAIVRPSSTSIVHRLKKRNKTTEGGANNSIFSVSPKRPNSPSLTQNSNKQKNTGNTSVRVSSSSGSRSASSTKPVTKKRIEPNISSTSIIPAPETPEISKPNFGKLLAENKVISHNVFEHYVNQVTKHNDNVLKKMKANERANRLSSSSATQKNGSRSVTTKATTTSASPKSPSSRPASSSSLSNNRLKLSNGSLTNRSSMGGTTSRSLVGCVPQEPREAELRNFDHMGQPPSLLYNAQMDECDRIKLCLAKKRIIVPSSVIERGIVIPEDLPFAMCKSNLPKPSTGLFDDVALVHPNGVKRRKSGNRSSRNSSRRTPRSGTAASNNHSSSGSGSGNGNGSRPNTSRLTTRSRPGSSTSNRASTAR